MSHHKDLHPSRRAFLKHASLALVGTGLAYHSVAASSFSRGRKPTLKVGLVGCGGRGTGAAAQALQADPDVVLTAMGDVFEDRLNASYNELVKTGKEKSESQ